MYVTHCFACFILLEPNLFRGLAKAIAAFKKTKTK